MTPPPVRCDLQMQTVLDFVGKREGFSIPEETVKLIAADANGNMRKAILVLEALKMQKYAPPHSQSQAVVV